MDNKAMLMILDRLEHQDEVLSSLMKFRDEYTEAKRVEKFNQVMECVDHFMDNEEDTKLYTVVREKEGEDLVFIDESQWMQLAVSIILKKLPLGRIIYVCGKLFPERDIMPILEEWEAECYDYDTHLLIGARPDSLCLDDSLLSLGKFNYTEDDVIAILKELTLPELANITPKIKIVRQKSI